MMDPMEAMWMGVQMHIKPMQDKLMEDFPEWNDATVGSIYEAYVRMLRDELGAPEEIIQFTLEDFQERVSSYEELWAEFKKGYLEEALKQMQ
jgi:hypothetical protein